MENPIPSNVALAVNCVAAPRKRLDALPAFRSLEDKYGVRIKVTHTGAEISKGAAHSPKILFRIGNPGKAKGGKARYAAEVAAMRHCIICLLHWANTHMPTPEVAAVLNDIAGAKH